MQMELHHLLLELYKSLFVTNCSHFPNRVKSSDALEIPESCADVRWSADRGDEQGTASVPRQPERVSIRAFLRARLLMFLRLSPEPLCAPTFDCLEAVCGTSLAQHSAHVVFDRLFRQVEARRNLLVSEAFAHQLHELLLSAGEA